MLETATGVFLYTISARCSRFLSIQTILNIFAAIWSVILNILSFAATWSDSDTWRIPSLIEDESIAMAVAEAFECLSASEIWLIPDTTCGEFSTHLEKQFESNLCRNSELLAIGCEGQFMDKNVETMPVASSEVVLQWSSVPESFESNSLPDIRYEQSLASIDQHADIGLGRNAGYQHSDSNLSMYSEDQDAQSELNINTEYQHSESELSINTEQLPIVSSKSITSECFRDFETSESNPSLDYACNKATRAPCQHSQLELSVNAEDHHSQSEHSINAEQLPIMSSKTRASECLSVYGNPERSPSPNSALKNAEKQFLQSRLTINAEDQDSLSGLSINAKEEHSESELSINEEQSSIASLNSEENDCIIVYSTPEIKSPLDPTLDKPTMLLYQYADFELGINGEDQHSDFELGINREGQHSQSELGINGEDQHSQSELDIDAEQLSITLSKEVTYKCPSVYDTPETNLSLYTTCINATMPLDQHSEPELSINTDQLQNASSKPVTNKFLSVDEIDENNSPLDATCKKTTMPSDQYSEFEVGLNGVNRDKHLELEPLQFASSKAVVSEFLSLFETPHPSEPEYNKNEESIPMAKELGTYASVPKTPDKKEQPKTICNSDDYLKTGDSAPPPPARVSPSAYIFARCFQNPDRNQLPETDHSKSLMPLAYSEYKRFAESCKSSGCTSSPQLNSLQFQSQFRKNAETTLFTVTFNQNFTYFACGTDQGIRVYKCDPFEEVFNGYFGHGGISIVEMYYATKILVFVGSEDNIQCPPNKVIIWDYEFHKCVHELTTDSKVKSVKISMDHMVVVLEQETCVYSCLEIEAKLLYRIKTLPNTKGLCALSDMPSNPVLVCPGLLKGQVCIEHFLPRKTRFVSAHDSHISCLALSKYGAILATASTKGTLLRIFNTSDGTCLQEVRRGSKRAEIYSIGISEIAQLLAMCSDKGTVHIVGLNEKVAKQERVAKRESNNLIGNARRQWNVSSGETGFVLQRANSSFSSSFSFMKGAVPKYFNSDRSFAQFHYSPNVRSLVGFGKHNTIVIICYDGSFYKCTFDPVHGGEMVQKLYKIFFRARLREN